MPTPAHQKLIVMPETADGGIVESRLNPSEREKKLDELNLSATRFGGVGEWLGFGLTQNNQGKISDSALAKLHFGEEAQSNARASLTVKLAPDATMSDRLKAVSPFSANGQASQLQAAVMKGARVFTVHADKSELKSLALTRSVKEIK